MTEIVYRVGYCCNKCGNILNELQEEHAPYIKEGHSVYVGDKPEVCPYCGDWRIELDIIGKEEI